MQCLLYNIKKNSQRFGPAIRFEEEELALLVSPRTLRGLFAVCGSVWCWSRCVYGCCQETSYLLCHVRRLDSEREMSRTGQARAIVADSVTHAACIIQTLGINKPRAEGNKLWCGSAAAQAMMLHLAVLFCLPFLVTAAPAALVSEGESGKKSIFCWTWTKLRGRWLE